MKTAIIIDLEGYWGMSLAPGLSHEYIKVDAGYTPKSDVYEFGHFMRCMCHGNNPYTNLVEWMLPEPLEEIASACMNESPDDRPTVDQLITMFEAIQAED